MVPKEEDKVIFGESHWHKKVQDPSKQRQVLERHPSNKVHNFSESIWSVTLPYNWVDKGNVVLMGCIDKSRQTEFLVHQLTLEWGKRTSLGGNGM